MSQSYDIIILGGEIAGLTAGREAAKLGRSTLVLTGNVLGGHLTSIELVEGWPDQPDGIPGYDLCPIAQDEAADAGAQFEMVEAESIAAENGRWRVSAGGVDYSADALILAMGASLKKLGVPGEDRLEGRGVSQCASCDAPMLRNLDTVVVGGGNSALQETLALLGPAARITILSDGPALTAQQNFRERVLTSPKVEIRYGCSVAEILGSDRVTGVKLTNGEEIACAAVFPFIGMIPNSALARDIAPLDGAGAVVVDAEMRTARPGLLAAGTLRAGAPFRAAGSAEDGATAARSAHGFLLDGTWSL